VCHPRADRFGKFHGHPFSLANLVVAMGSRSGDFFSFREDRHRGSRFSRERGDSSYIGHGENRKANGTPAPSLALTKEMNLREGNNPGHIQSIETTSRRSSI